MNLLRYVVKCTVTESPFNTQANCSKCPPSAWMNFLTRVARELVSLRSTAALLMLVATLRIRWSSSSIVSILCARPTHGNLMGSDPVTGDQFCAPPRPIHQFGNIQMLLYDLTEMRWHSVMLVIHLLSCL